ncbi:MAG: alpha-hydroxy acid oxidase [Vicinamibacterales bacterium]
MRGAFQGPQPRRKPPRIEDLVNVLEFEEVAAQTLPAARLATIAGSDRTAFDQITLRPRMLIPTLDLDLSVDLFGETHIAPIFVGPIADQRRYHADGELATVRGASAGKAAAIVSSGSSVPIAELAAQAKTPLWYSVYADGTAATQKQIQQAVAAGCKAVCATVGALPAGARSTSSVDRPMARARPIAGGDWKAVDQIRRAVSVPFLIKGVMTVEDAKRAIDQGAQGLIVSNHGAASSAVAPIEVVPSIADALAGKATLLVDGSFRRGSDILKALILGAQAVLIARPVMWGLAAYGAAGVQSVIERLQSDLGRHMGALGTPNLKALNRNFVRIHRK